MKTKIDKTLLFLYSALFLILFLIVSLTVLAIVTSPSPSIKITVKDYVLEDVKYLGYDDDSCYGYACTAQFKFSDGTNIYKLTGHGHEMDTMVVDSFYNIHYDNYSKEIKSYDFSVNAK